MSTILKALRRLEEEKTRDGSPRPLREEVASGSGEGPRRRWTSWLPLLALAVGAGLGASAWWLWPYEFERALDDGTLAPSAVAAPAPLEPVAAAPVQPVPAPVVSADIPPDADAAIRGMAAQLEEGAPEGPPEDAFASDVAVVDRPTPSPRIEPVAPAPPAPVARVQDDPISNPPPAPGSVPPGELAREEITRPHDAPSSLVAAGERSGERSKPSSRAQYEPKATIEPDPIAVPKPSEPVRTAAAAPKPAPPTPAPAAASAASDRAPSAPPTDVYVTRTQWHPEHARRSADVNVAGKERSVKEGDVVGEYVVNEIKPSGVVLTHDGEKIEQKIGKPPKEARSEP